MRLAHYVLCRLHSVGRYSVRTLQLPDSWAHHGRYAVHALIVRIIWTLIDRPDRVRIEGKTGYVKTYVQTKPPPLLFWCVRAVVPRPIRSRTAAT